MVLSCITGPGGDGERNSPQRSANANPCVRCTCLTVMQSCDWVEQRTWFLDSRTVLMAECSLVGPYRKKVASSLSLLQSPTDSNLVLTDGGCSFPKFAIISTSMPTLYESAVVGAGRHYGIHN